MFELTWTLVVVLLIGLIGMVGFIAFLASRPIDYWDNDGQ